MKQDCFQSLDWTSPNYPWHCQGALHVMNWSPLINGTQAVIEPSKQRASWGVNRWEDQPGTNPGTSIVDGDCNVAREGAQSDGRGTETSCFFRWPTADSLPLTRPKKIVL